MRSMFRSVLVALVAVLALGAVAVSGASAHEYRVEGKALGGEEAFTGIGGTVHMSGNGFFASVKVECGGSMSKGTLREGNKASLSSTEFTGCVITKPTGCRFTKGAIHSEYLAQLTTPPGGGVGVEKSGLGGAKEVAVLEIENAPGSECAIPTLHYSMTGHWTCELREAGVEAVEHEEICKEGEDQLKIGSNGWFWGKYSEKVKLVSGKKWSAI